MNYYTQRVNELLPAQALPTNTGAAGSLSAVAADPSNNKKDGRRLL